VKKELDRKEKGGENEVTRKPEKLNFIWEEES